MTSDGSPRPISPLRARMIEDMTVRVLSRLFRRLFLAALVESNEATVRDGDAMGVPGEIGKHCSGPAKGGLA